MAAFDTARRPGVRPRVPRESAAGEGGGGEIWSSDAVASIPIVPRQATPRSVPAGRSSRAVATRFPADAGEPDAEGGGRGRGAAIDERLAVRGSAEHLRGRRSRGPRRRRKGARRLSRRMKVTPKSNARAPGARAKGTRTKVRSRSDEVDSCPYRDRGACFATEGAKRPKERDTGLEPATSTLGRSHSTN